MQFQKVTALPTTLLPDTLYLVSDGHTVVEYVSNNTGTGILPVKAAVASFTDLTNVPTIPTTAGQIGAISTTQLSSLATNSSVSNAIAAITPASLGVVTAAQVNTEIQNLIGAAPAAVTTLQSIGAQLAGNTSLATSIVNTIAGYAPLNSPLFTGNVQGITKAMVGLPNVDNTADINKPISTATQTALDLKANVSDVMTAAQTNSAIQSIVGTAPAALSTLQAIGVQLNTNTNAASNIVNLLATKANLASPRFTGTVKGITPTMIGLSNVDNTHDLDKPVSTATQSALDTKANISDVYTKAEVNSEIQNVVGVAPAALATLQTIGTQLAGNSNAASSIVTAMSGFAPIANPVFTGLVKGITPAMIGLSDVDNTHDLDKPISTATQLALDAKLNIADAYTQEQALTDIQTAIVAAPAALTTLQTIGNSLNSNTSAAQAITNLVTSKASSFSPTFTGTVKGITGSMITITPTPTLMSLNVQDGISELDFKKASKTYVTSAIAGITPTSIGAIGTNQLSSLTSTIISSLSGATIEALVSTQLATLAPIDSPTFTGTVKGITPAMVSLGDFNGLTPATLPISTATQTALSGKADLDSSNHILLSQIPTGAFTGLSPISTWDATQPFPPATNANKGGFYIISVPGNGYNINDWALSNGTSWDKIVNSGLVTSVNTKSGAVVLVPADIGLSNVDNTHDLDKPVSTATQTALTALAPIHAPTFTGTVTVSNLKNSNLSPNSLVVTDLNNNLASSTVTALELSFLHGVISPIQTQLSNLAPLSNPTFTGTLVANNITDITLNNNTVVIATTGGTLASSLTTSVELSYVHGVKSAIQTQLDAKASLANPSFTGTLTAANIAVTGLTTGTAVVADGNGKLLSSITTSTELGYVSGITSSIQTQIDSKQANLVSGTNIVTINGTSLLGSGDVTITPGSLGAVTMTEVNTAIQAVVGAAPLALATLKAINDQLASDESAAGVLTTTVSTKAPIDSPTFTGNVTVSTLNPNSAVVTGAGGLLQTTNTSATQIGYLNNVSSDIQTQLNVLAPINNPVFTGTVSGITAAMVGAIPSATLSSLATAASVSAITTTSLGAATTAQVALLAPLASPVFTGIVGGITADMVGAIPTSTLASLATTASVAAITTTSLGAATTAQVALLAPIASPTFTGTLTAAAITDTGLTDNTALIAGAGGALASSSVTSTELGYVHGVTSAIQDQINALSSATATTVSPTFTGTLTAPIIVDSGLTANTVVYANGNKTLSSSPTTATELGYVHGVTSAIQTQLNALAPLASPTFTGTVSGITASMVGAATMAQVNTAIQAVVGAAPAALATLQAIDAQLSTDESAVSALTTVVSSKAPINNPAFTGTVTGITATMVGAIPTSQASSFATTASVGAITAASIGAIPSTQLASLATTASVAAITATSLGAATTAQVSALAPLASPTFTGTVNGITASMVGAIPTTQASSFATTASVAAITASSLGAATTAQVAALAPLANPTFTGTLTAVNITDSGLTANTALIAGTGGALASSTTTATELGYVHGVTSAIQTQLNALAPLASPTFTGTVTAGTITSSSTITGGVVSDSIGSLRTIPMNTQTVPTSYTLVASDSGKRVSVSGSVTTVVVPASVFAASNIVLIYNANTTSAATITINTSAITAYLDSTIVAKTSITLAAQGMCSINFNSGTNAVFAGKGLS